ncbi:MAG TPA: neutral zinc metallopeptidase [Steroidobacteraceae bacterium]|nr:neutral zinc metallopeptidase [Steroidobacteraceae bacterium]
MSAMYRIRAARIRVPALLGGALALLLSVTALVQAATRAGDEAGDSAVVRAQALLQAGNAYWTREFVTLKAVYQPAQLSLYAHALSNACGVNGMLVGPFYCPEDSHVYLPRDYLRQIADKAGTSADLALAYVVGHELGTHIQDLIGTTEQVEQARARSTPQLSARTWAVAELQADCYAGLAVRAGLAQRQIAAGDASAALQAVASVTQALQAHLKSGEVMPDPVQTYLTPAQRLEWFQRGLGSGNFADCDTFSAEAAGKL